MSRLAPRTAFAPLLIAVLAALGLVASACGGDDEVADTTTSVAAAGGTSDATSGEGDESTEDPDVDDPATDDPATDDPAAGDVDFAFDSKECEQFAKAFDQQMFTSTDQDPTEGFRETAAYFADAADKVPAEIAGDVRTLAEVYQELADASAGIDWSALERGDAAGAMAAAELSQVYANHTEFAEAGERLSAYVMEHCTR